MERERSKQYHSSCAPGRPARNDRKPIAATLAGSDDDDYENAVDRRLSSSSASQRNGTVK
jgi:hypothetical protein